MPLTDDDLREFLNMDALPTGSRLVEFQRALRTATSGVTRRTGMLDGATVTARVVAVGGLLRLPYQRLASIGTVTDPGGVVAAPWSVDLDAGLVWVSSWGGSWGSSSPAWSVQCTGQPWPDELSTAALEWAAHVLDSQRTTVNAVDSDDDVGIPSFAVPNRVAEWLHPYELHGFA